MPADTETDPIIHFRIYFAKAVAPEDPLTRTLVHIDLHIPTSHIAHYSNKPVAWLRFLGYAITGHEYPINARLDPDSDEEEEVPVPLDATALERHHYSYGARDMAEAMDMTRFVNLANVEPRRESSSASSSKIDGRDRLQSPADARDGRCVFTAQGVSLSQVCHIIPHKVKHKRWRALANARDFTFQDGNVDSITNVISLSGVLHVLLDRHKMIILATDNRFLKDEDVDPPAEEAKPSFIQPRWEAMARPADRSLILQYLPANNAQEEFELAVASHNGAYHNTRARFANVAEPDSLPCKEALHYVYGGVMLRRYIRADDREVKLGWLTDQSEEERAPYDDGSFSEDESTEDDDAGGQYRPSGSKKSYMPPEGSERRISSRVRGHDDVFERIWEELQAARAADRQIVQNMVEQKHREENHQKVTGWLGL